MMKKTTLVLSAALVLGSGSTALAQVYIAPYGPGPVVVTPYALPYAVVRPYPLYARGPYSNVWWGDRRAFHQRRSMGDTNGF